MIPDELRKQPNWVIWHREERDGKFTKVPYDPKTGDRAKSNGPTTWGTLAEAQAAVKKFNAAGTGFMFSKDDPYCGIDFDHCRDPATGEIQPDRLDWIKRFASYAEVSPSGTGVHIIVRGRVEKGRKSPKHQVEVYSQERYFTWTGDRLPDSPDTVEERQEVINEFLATFWPPQEAPTPSPVEMPTDEREDTDEVPDDELISKMSEKAKGFKALWEGDISGHDGDHSAADQALCNCLAWWTNKNVVQIDRLFRQSGLYREKWDREDYRTATIAKAIKDCKGGYGDNPFKGTGCFPKNGGLYYKKTAGGTSYDVQLTNFVPRPLREILLDDGTGPPTRLFEIEGTMTGRKLSPVKVPANGYASLNFLNDAWGLAPYITPGQNHREKVRYLIQFSAQGIPCETVFGHTGWRKIGDKWAFLHGGGAIGAEGVKVDVARLGLDRYVLPDQADLETEKQAVKLLFDMLDVAPERITIPLTALVFLAPLTEFLRQGGCDPTFLIFLIFLLGRTQTMKSTLAGLYLSCYGQFDRNGLPANFKFTANALERAAAAAKDVVLVVDDFHPVSNTMEARRMAANLQALARGYGDRSGRARLDSDAKTMKAAYVPKGLCLITGEDIPNIGQSGISRFLVLDLNSGDVDTEKLSKVQAQADLLPYAMAGFIRFMSRELRADDNLPAALNQKFSEAREMATKDTYGRLPEIVAWLNIGFVLLLGYAHEIGVIRDTAEIETRLAGAFRVLCEIMGTHNKTVTDESPDIKFITTFHDLLETGQVYVQTLGTGQRHGNGEFIGWEDTEHYFLLPGPAYTAVFKAFQARGELFPVSEKRLWKSLAQSGKITTGGDNEKRVKKIDGRPQRVIWLKKGSVETAGEYDTVTD